LREAHGRGYEAAAIYLGSVHAHAQRYVSEATLKRCRESQHRNRALLEELVAINELGEEFTLQDLAERSTSNPRLRRTANVKRT